MHIVSLLVGWAFRWLDGKDGGLLAAETEHAADEQPVPYWPADPPKVPTSDDIEWQRIVRAFKEDGL